MLKLAKTVKRIVGFFANTMVVALVLLIFVGPYLINIWLGVIISVFLIVFAAHCWANDYIETKERE